MPVYKTTKRKDGKNQYRVVVNYTDASGRHRTIDRLTYGHEEALNLEAQLKISVGHKLEWMAPLTMDEFQIEFMKHKASECRESTLTTNGKLYRNHIKGSFGSMKLTEITTPMIVLWKQELNNSSLATTTKNHCFDVLRAILNFAVLVGVLQKSPMIGIKEFRDPDWVMPDQKLHYYTSEEFYAFARAAKADTGTFYKWSTYVFFVIAYFTGLRKGEIHGLRWSDIDGDMLHVRRSVRQSGQGAVITPPKNRSSYRSLQISKTLLRVLAENKARQQAEFPGVWNQEYNVIRGRGYIANTSLQYYCDRWAQKAHLPHIRVHDFRHSNASLLANSGISLLDIAKRLGHSTTREVEQRYAHLYPSETERAVSVLDQVRIP